MSELTVNSFEDQLTLYFESELPRINAYTLASTLVAMADAVKASSILVNPGYNVEIVVDALGPGSFKVKIKTLFTKTRNLFSKENIKPVALSIVAAFIYEKFIADNNVKIIINTDEVLIQNGSDKLIVPRDVYEKVKVVKKSEKFTSNIGKVFGAINNDSKINGFGMMATYDQEKPEIIVPKERFANLVETIEIEENCKSVTENANLVISRAILEKGKRKWEFVWRGVKISAPVIDDSFYKDFFDHKIKIAPGDVLNVELKIYQSKDPDTQIFTNSKYEVILVNEHIPIKEQQSLID